MQSSYSGFISSKSFFRFFILNDINVLVFQSIVARVCCALGFFLFSSFFIIKKRSIIDAGTENQKPRTWAFILYDYRCKRRVNVISHYRRRMTVRLEEQKSVQGKLTGWEQNFTKAKPRFRCF